MANESMPYVRAIGSDFLVMDEWAYYAHTYEGTSVLPNEDLYALKSVFRMRSQIDAEKNATLAGRTRRKRKHSCKLLIGADPDFIELCTSIETRLQQITVANSKLFEISPNEMSSDANNERARSAVSHIECSTQSSAILTHISHKNEPSLGDFHLTANNCVLDKIPDECTLWTNESCSFLTLTCGYEKFIVPPKCAFIIGDVSLSRHLIARGMLFDVIIMDPPWMNKSVKRKKSYAIFDDERDLLELRINELLSDNGLLAIWVTNDKKLKRYVKDIIESYGLVRLAYCHWLKVTTSGEPICKFQPHHKVPFETFVLACREPFIGSYTGKVKQNFLLISTPSAIHSKKPPLLAVFKAMHLVEDGNCLELYGRYLLPNTTTIGFEAVKLQNVRYFKMSRSAD
ncbi:Methyltransferase-like protein 4 [Toxocara canis]|uniref:Methyltransferase-like protein 4 n=1 Tax=Toxocara canis TaxID=6265 RepID=A0A0B2VIN6_TOXCA|nr:Methyltransferase-like protein 4 [Toxocara canis]